MEGWWGEKNRARHVGPLALQLRRHSVVDDASECAHQNPRVAKKVRQESGKCGSQRFEGSVCNINENLVPWDIHWPRYGAEGEKFYSFRRGGVLVTVAMRTLSKSFDYRLNNVSQQSTS